jgi:uncharacterized protein (DUF1684 family)
MYSTFRIHLIFFALLFSLSSIAQQRSYEDSVKNWYHQRRKDLKAPDGWINLTGLFWLEKGKISMGRVSKNGIAIDHPDMPELAGDLTVTENEIIWTTHPGSRVLLNNEAVNSLVIYNTTQTHQPQLAIGSLRFNVIVRGDKKGIRLRDLNAPALKQFKAPPRFPVNQKWKIPAAFEPIPSGTIAIQNVLGQVNREASPGQLVFTYQQKTYRLDVLNEGNYWFVLFADATSGKSTYPTGRFLYVAKNKETDQVYLDFNLAFNPPCAFTNFATCPIPPAQNRLPFAVSAGEKYQKHGTH